MIPKKDYCCEDYHYINCWDWAEKLKSRSDRIHKLNLYKYCQKQIYKFFPNQNKKGVIKPFNTLL